MQRVKTFLSFLAASVISSLSDLATRLRGGFLVGRRRLAKWQVDRHAFDSQASSSPSDTSTRLTKKLASADERLTAWRSRDHEKRSLKHLAAGYLCIAAGAFIAVQFVIRDRPELGGGIDEIRASRQAVDEVFGDSDALVENGQPERDSDGSRQVTTRSGSEEPDVSGSERRSESLNEDATAGPIDALRLVLGQDVASAMQTLKSLCGTTGNVVWPRQGQSGRTNSREYFEEDVTALRFEIDGGQSIMARVGVDSVMALAIDDRVYRITLYHKSVWSNLSRSSLQSMGLSKNVSEAEGNRRARRVIDRLGFLELYGEDVPVYVDLLDLRPVSGLEGDPVPWNEVNDFKQMIGMLQRRRASLSPLQQVTANLYEQNGVAWGPTFWVKGVADGTGTFVQNDRGVIVVADLRPWERVAGTADDGLSQRETFIHLIDDTYVRSTGSERADRVRAE